MKLRKENFTDTQDFLLSVIGSAPYGIITIDLKGEITMVNDLAKEFFEITEDVNDIIDMHIDRFIEDIPKLREMIKKCIEKEPEDFDLLAVPFHDRYLTVRGRPFHDGVTVTIQDITRIRQMEGEALNSMLIGQEQERKRLAKEIHDGLGPLLSTLRMNMEAIKVEVGKISKETQSKFQNTNDLIDTLADDMRSISHDLMPRVLDDFGLVEAFQNLASRINKSNKITVEFYSAVAGKRFDKSVELSLYRIGQELIHNALKHSGAKKINLQLIEHKDSLVLMAEDNGNGFEPGGDRRKGGIGLDNIEIRTKALEGIFEINSSKGKGVTASIEIPV